MAFYIVDHNRKLIVFSSFLILQIDVALDLIHQYPELATSKIELGNITATKVPAVPTSPLANLAAKVSAFPSGSRLNFWQRRIYSCKFPFILRY